MLDHSAEAPRATWCLFKTWADFLVVTCSGQVQRNALFYMWHPIGT